uniref:Myosin heavy chain n=1 Tax=Peronospora matthiolae TaxID=2874970 RepID=A0AAV1UEW6_9STRA
MITKLQARYRCQVQRRAFIEKRKKCVIVQSVWRGVRSRQRMYLLMKGNSAVLIQSAYRKHLAEQKYTKLRNATIKIQCMLKTRKQTEVDLLKHRLEDEKRARLEIEAENSSLQQELKEVRGSSVLTANSSICEGEALHTLPSSSWSKGFTKGREHGRRDLSQENENLKTENKKIKDAYTAAGASFAALNQHNKRQSKANLRLMSTHAALIKSQEEKMKRYKKQVAELKEDLLMQRSVYSAELKARVQQQDVITEVIKLAKSGGLSEELLEHMRAMAVDFRPSIDNGQASNTSEYRLSSVASNVAKVSENRENRSETTTAIGPCLCRLLIARTCLLHGAPRYPR